VAQRNSSRTECSQQLPKKGCHYSNSPETEKFSDSPSDITLTDAETHDDSLRLLAEQCTRSAVQQMNREIQPSYHNL